MSSKSVFFFFLLFSLPRRICSPFSFTIFLVLHAQVSSAAILFAENSYTKQFFSRGKKILTQNKLVCGFFFTVSSKTMCGDFKGEQKISDLRKNMEKWKQGSYRSPEKKFHSFSIVFPQHSNFFP